MTEDLPTKEEAKKQLRGMNNPGDQWNYLEDLEKRLRIARIARQFRPHEDLTALVAFVRDEKEEVEQWKEQHLARKQRGQFELIGRAFTAPSGSEKLQEHLRIVRWHNERLREQAEAYRLLPRLAEHEAQERKAERELPDADELARGYKSNVEDYQQRLLGLIEAYADALEIAGEREEYLRQIRLWYEEADYIHSTGLPPFAGVLRGVEALVIGKLTDSGKAEDKPAQDEADPSKESSEDDLRRISGVAHDHVLHMGKKIHNFRSQHGKDHGEGKDGEDKKRILSVWTAGDIKDWLREGYINPDTGKKYCRTTLTTAAQKAECWVNDKQGSRAGLKESLDRLERYYLLYREKTEENS